MQFEQRQRINLTRENPILVRQQPIVKGDKHALKWIVEVVRDDVTVDLTGATVSVSCAREGNAGTVTGDGCIEGGCAVAVLPDTSANVPGQVRCTMTIASGGDVVAIAQMAVMAEDTVGDRIVVDEEAMASMAQLGAEIAASQSATAAANAAAAKIDGMTVAAATLAEGSAATATISEVGGVKHVAFGIPRGEKGEPGATGATGATGPKGDTGATPQITFQVATGAPGTQATATVSGTAENPVIHLTIPRGETGKIENLTINGKEIVNGTVTLTASDVGAVPTSRKVAGHALTADIAIATTDLTGRGVAAFSLASSAFTLSSADSMYHASVSVAGMTATCAADVADLAGADELIYLAVDTGAGQADVIALPKPTGTVSGRLIWREEGT